MDRLRTGSHRQHIQRTSDATIARSLAARLRHRAWGISYCTHISHQCTHMHRQLQRWSQPRGAWRRPSRARRKPPHQLLRIPPPAPRSVAQAAASQNAPFYAGRRAGRQQRKPRHTTAGLGAWTAARRRCLEARRWIYLSLSTRQRPSVRRGASHSREQQCQRASCRDHG